MANPFWTGFGNAIGANMDTMNYANIIDGLLSSLGADTGSNTILVSIVNHNNPASAPIVFSSTLPDSVTENLSTPNFDAKMVVGRSSPAAAYSGGSQRSISFSLRLHRDLFTGKNNNSAVNMAGLLSAATDKSLAQAAGTATGIATMAMAGLGGIVGAIGSSVGENAVVNEFESVINSLRALNYPLYTPAGVVPPRISCTLGKSISITGYAQIGITHKRPVKFNKYMIAEVSFNFTEVLGISWSALNVSNGALSRPLTSGLIDATSLGTMINSLIR